ncbi:hypothetical protein KCU61_g132, partial [Aureobasidium melanogenum]
LLTRSGVNNGDVWVCVVAVSVLEIVLNIWSAARIILGVLQEDEVLLNGLLDLRVLPDVTVENLAIEDRRILHVDDYPLLLFFSFVASVLER